MELFTLELNNPIQGEIEIYSLNGHLLHRRPIISSSEKIDLSSFSKGVYSITIRSLDDIWTERIIKLQ